MSLFLLLAALYVICGALAYILMESYKVYDEITLPRTPTRVLHTAASLSWPFMLPAIIYLRAYYRQKLLIPLFFRKPHKEPS